MKRRAFIHCGRRTPTKAELREVLSWFDCDTDATANHLWQETAAGRGIGTAVNVEAKDDPLLRHCRNTFRQWWEPL